MIVEAMLLGKIVLGVKAALAHGGVAAAIANQAVGTAASAGVATAAAQTAGTLATVGTVAAVATGGARMIDGVAAGRPARAAIGAAQVAGATHGWAWD